MSNDVNGERAKSEPERIDEWRDATVALEVSLYGAKAYQAYDNV